ncbi:class I SAM-dependent methyltransferase [Aureimonas frigidaquae]|uniref:Phospholipid N-methyltransferase n=1 Tax=Aureimonas frigidaquae TaxID=424757 RepID=A0A0P0Z153_9HYPH|nr:rRNA adenine N-6-methyltransferase family protein [Aureimonas frigidaquae]BAT27659.1 phospholipid N-methyltransferase [Aureimonas frigidaquae]
MHSKNSASQTERRRRGDEATFLAGWLRKPLMTGAILPSSRGLCAAMAAKVPLAEACDGRAAVLELGPGTGAVTRALLAHGIPEANLVLLEYASAFCTLLRKRHAGARVIEGDAYDPGGALRDALGGRRIAAIVSSLPLMTRPESEREAALGGYLSLLDCQAPFIQFTYALTMPVRAERIGARLDGVSWVARNLPPARVLVYRRADPAGAATGA